MSTKIHKYGFTLVEISIVLVIIGLIIGGVLVGRDLIRSSEIRGTVTQQEKYNTAVNTFRSKYNCLPGDCSNVTEFGLTSNGDGDGIIGICRSKTSCKYPNNRQPENAAFWTHLGSANLINDALGVEQYEGGPASAVKPLWANAGWSMIAEATFDTVFGGGTFNSHSFLLKGGAIDNNNSIRPYHPADMAAIDGKIDDGIPVSGNVRAFAQIATKFIGPNVSRYYFGSSFYMADTITNFNLGLGAGGAANVCVRNDTTPYSYNINPVSIDPFLGGCGLVIKASF